MKKQIYLSLQPVRLETWLKVNYPKNMEYLFVAYKTKKDALKASDGDEDRVLVLNVTIDK